MPRDLAAEPAGLPDLLILGDSHTAALDLAARARGLRTVLVYISGNHWHSGVVSGDAERGLASRIVAVQAGVDAARAEMGGRLFRPEVPVLASVGYHLGRLCHGIERFGHRADAGAFREAPDSQFVSAAVLEAMVTAQRQRLWRLLSFVAREAPVTAVAPPVISDNPHFARVARLVTAQLRRRGVPVFDPRETGGAFAQPIPETMRSADGVHGNADYGAWVLDQLSIRARLHAA